MTKSLFALVAPDLINHFSNLFWTNFGTSHVSWTYSFSPVPMMTSKSSVFRAAHIHTPAPYPWLPLPRMTSPSKWYSSPPFILNTFSTMIWCHLWRPSPSPKTRVMSVVPYSRTKACRGNRNLLGTHRFLSCLILCFAKTRTKRGKIS